MSRHRHPVKIRARLGDAWRQGGVAVLAIGGVLGLGLFATDHFMAAKRTPPAAAAPATAANDEEIYTGSILYMPEQGRVCRQLLFDNQTGRISDNGYVDCKAAAYSDDGTSKHWSVARMRVISSGFLQR